MDAQIIDWEMGMQLWLNDPDPFIRQRAKELLFEDKLEKAGLLGEYLQIVWNS